MADNANDGLNFLFLLKGFQSPFPEREGNRIFIIIFLNTFYKVIFCFAKYLPNLKIIYKPIIFALSLFTLNRIKPSAAVTPASNPLNSSMALKNEL